MAQPAVHFEIIGQDPEKVRGGDALSPAVPLRVGDDRRPGGRPGGRPGALGRGAQHHPGDVLAGGASRQGAGR